MKDRSKTEEEILSAVDTVICREGFTSLGVNAVAREAGVSKVLIYRYFDDFDGLIRRWAEKNNYWTEKNSQIDGDADSKELVKSIFAEYGRSLRKDAARREMLRWLLARDTDTGRRIMERTEESGLELSRLFTSRSSAEKSCDTEALFALLTAGISYLSLMEDRAGVFNGIDIRSAEGWERINRMISAIIDELL